MYCLPKSNKSALISQAIAKQNNKYVEVLEPSDFKLRSVAAGPTYPIRPLSGLLDNIFKPFILHVNSNVSENIDFLERCSRVKNENTIFMTFDVISLYIDTPHAYELEALSYWIDKHPGSLHKRFSKTICIRSNRLILENNNCNFNYEFFVQMNGTATETMFTLTYATLRMGYFKLTFYKICINELGETLGHFILENWRWFLDDCETPLGKTKIDSNRLLKILNSINPSIKFTMETSDKELPFLHILIKRNDAKYGSIFIFSQQTLPGVSHSRPAI